MESGGGEAHTLSVPLHGRPFSQLPLHPSLQETLKRHAFKRSTILQDLALPEFIRGRDLILKARRGSGKGVLLLLAALDFLARRPRDKKSSVLILVPQETRAKLLGSWTRTLGENLDFNLVVFPGEGEIQEDLLKALERGPDLLLTTPDGLNRLYKWGLWKPQGLGVVIVDELEKMVARSQKFIQQLLGKLSPPTGRQTLILLENLDYQALEVAYQQTQNPEELYIEEGRQDFSSLKLYLIHLSREEKFPLLLGLLKRKGWPRALIFVNEKLEAQKLTEDLKALGLSTILLKPELPPPLRLNFLKRFAQGEARLMIATDAGTRFIQDPNLNLLINYDLPELPSDFRQRAARLSSEGEIYSLCDETGAFFLEAIEKDIGQKMEVLFPEPEEEWFLSPAQAKDLLRPARPKGSPKRFSRPKTAKRQPHSR